MLVTHLRELAEDALPTEVPFSHGLHDARHERRRDDGTHVSPERGRARELIASWAGIDPAHAQNRHIYPGGRRTTAAPSTGETPLPLSARGWGRGVRRAGRYRSDGGGSARVLDKHDYVDRRGSDHAALPVLETLRPLRAGIRHVANTLDRSA